jgi:acyl-CoA synthetase (AMP-forming)/AMP-acid ligase II
MMSHKTLLPNAKAQKVLWEITDQDRLFHALPIFHTHRLFVALNTSLLAGASHLILERYGMTEANTITSTPYHGERIAGTVGYPLPGTEVHIRNKQTSKSIPSDEIDMIEVRGVQKSAVFGVPHPDFGESVVAVIVLEPGSSLTGQGIAEQITRLLVGFKPPRKYIVSDALPRNTMGKAQKNMLRQEHS